MQTVLTFLPLVLILAAFAAAFFFLRSRRPGNRAYQAASGLALFTGFLLLWVTLGVGLFGEPDRTETLLVLGTLALGAIGALLARFRPEGMARALYAVAVAQALHIAFAFATGATSTAYLDREVIFNAVFAGLFAAAGWLFQRSAGAPLAGKKTPDGVPAEVAAE